MGRLSSLHLHRLSTGRCRLRKQIARASTVDGGNDADVALVSILPEQVCVWLPPRPIYYSNISRITFEVWSNKVSQKALLLRYKIGSRHYAQTLPGNRHLHS